MSQREPIRTVFLLLLLCVLFAANAPAADARPDFPRTPDEAALVASDLKNFAAAQERIKAGGDAETVLREMYFEKASPGLKDFAGRTGLTPSKLAAAVRTHPDVFRGVGEFLEKGLPDFEKEYRKVLGRYAEIVPGAVFPPTYLLVGANQSVGLGSTEGQLVTVERSLGNREELLTLIVHELTHSQQAAAVGVEKYRALYAADNNMLGIVLREGAADFVTYGLVRKDAEQRPRRFGEYEKNEYDLWIRFNKDLKTQDMERWVGTADEGLPSLLGYAVGYRIVESFYERAADKEKALRELLTIGDAAAFLEKSGYRPASTDLERELVFGRPHPSAPAAIRDYGELIGISECDSEQRNPDGSWAAPQRIIWTFRYILDGRAVMDETHKADGFHTSSIREYNEKDSKWHVHYFSPVKGAAAQVPTWTGVRKESEFILYRDQKAPNGLEGFYKIRFYDISPEGFEWLGAWVSKDGSIVYETWKISCRKKEL